MYPIFEEPNFLRFLGGNFITIEKFESMFGSKEVHDFKYDYLYNHEKATEGWKKAFDEWKQKGILK